MARQRDAEATAFTAGDIGLAVQTSAAIEGRLAPVRIHGETYVDADWVAPLPVRIARRLGATRVLAVDASVHLDRAPAAASRYREGDLKKQALVAADALHADLVLKPDFGYWVSFSRDFRERAIVLPATARRWRGPRAFTLCTSLDQSLPPPRLVDRASATGSHNYLPQCGYGCDQVHG